MPVEHSTILVHNLVSSVKTKKLLTIVKLNALIKLNPIVISSGMPRSGSTLLFNILRELLSYKWGCENFSSFWIYDINFKNRSSKFLIKTHTMNRAFGIRAYKNFYCYRDIRTVLVSSSKFFNRPPSMQFVDKLIKIYRAAMYNCDAVYSYEQLVEDPREVIRKSANILNIDLSSTYLNNIVQETSSLKSSGGSHYSAKTLMHKNHCTNTQEEEWKNFLDKKLLEDIYKKYDWWFEETGYKM